MIQLTAFALIWWLGLYLISRDLRNSVLRYAGLGCLSFALSLAVDQLNQFEANLITIRQLLALLPAGFWLLTVAILWREVRSQPISKRMIGVLLFGLIGLFLETALLLIPVLPRDLILALMCGDIALLAVIIAYLDAFNLGESLIPHMLRSFDSAMLTALVFGGQVGLVIAATSINLPLLILLYATIASAISLQAIQPQLQTLFDKISFIASPKLRQSRAELRHTEDQLPRTPPVPDLSAMEETEFVRLTRRALTHVSDLPRLAACPLIHLPAITQRLAARSATDNVIERTIELKTLLLESIHKLKPQNGHHASTTNEWRHYNALYYPYVLGLKPYNTRLNADDIDPQYRDILSWFQQQVPERTLYNWQNAAAKLVAQDLRSSW